ncbi:MAG: response regulator, partial [Candidatus Omnitrophica bacterium]|nr:response regulator [Candidatus Omnitrophota bacterium]
KANEEKEDNLNCKGVRILVVEDAVPNQELLKAYFLSMECEGDYVNNGRQAVEILKKNKDKYDLCLMDMQMPVMGGVEAAKVIRAEISKELPIIALTAAVLKEDQEQALSAGMNDFLTKPVDVKKLKAAILKYSQRRT